MADFVSDFWSWFIAIAVIASVLACFALIWWMERDRPSEEDVEATGHTWDETLQELNNPLPRWWLNMFYITLVFGIIYLLLYPGLGSYAGMLGWSEVQEYESEMAQADDKYAPLFARFSGQSLADLAAEPEAMQMGERLFVNYCTQCHGSDAGGVPGFPNLRDDDWLWGGSPEAIKQSILEGRTGTMPGWKAALGGDQGVSDTASYVLSLSGRDVDQAAASRGKEKFAMLCVSCHGLEGKGNQALGAPNLSDTTWLYGGSMGAVVRSIAEGRSGRMPAHKEFLGEARIHLLAGYIYNLSAK